MIDITPTASEESYVSFQYNHLGYTLGGGHEYPLHMVLRHGGSVELVKFLVSADKEGETLESGKNSVYHVLVANRDKHQPEAFSEILRYLVLSTKRKNYYFSKLSSENEADKKTPVGLFAHSLKEEGLSNADVLVNEDFAFLLKATCYHHRSRSSRQEDDDPSDKVCEDIEVIPLDRAFLVCGPCFGEEFVAEVLEELVSADSRFLLDKDAADEDRYPLHHILEDRPSYSVMVGANNFSDGFKLFIVDTILKLAPQCARKWDQKGRLPLHIAADGQRGIMKADKRLTLVRTIWKAYPEAVGFMDKELCLPPFALPTRAERSRRCYDSDDEDDEYTAFSSTYFLLRQNPEMIAEAIAVCTAANAKDAKEPAAKRQRSSST